VSEALSMSSRQILIPPTQYVSSLGAGEHGVIFYTSKEEMRNIHFAFVKSGLENNWEIYALLLLDNVNPYVIYWLSRSAS
jgi:hypothetical protein